MRSGQADGSTECVWGKPMGPKNAFGASRWVHGMRSAQADGATECVRGKPMEPRNAFGASRWVHGMRSGQADGSTPIQLGKPYLKHNCISKIHLRLSFSQIICIFLNNFFLRLRRGFGGSRCLRHYPFRLSLYLLFLLPQLEFYTLQMTTMF